MTLRKFDRLECYRNYLQNEKFPYADLSILDHFVESDDLLFHIAIRLYVANDVVMDVAERAEAVMEARSTAATDRVSHRAKLGSRVGVYMAEIDL